MTPRLLPLSMLLAAFTLASPVVAQEPPPGMPGEARHQAEDWDPQFRNLQHDRFGIVPLHRAAQIVGKRFQGRLIAARLVPPRPEERARGVELVHHLRLLTPARAVLEIRLDARSGAFLEVSGAGLTEARRKGDRR